MFLQQTSLHDLITACKLLPGVGDHDAVHIRAISTIRYSKPTQREVYLWNKTNFEAIKEDFKQFSTTFVANNSVDTNVNLLWTAFRDKCMNIVADQVPSKRTSARHHQPWINRSIKQLSHRKQHCYNKARSTKLAEDRVEYKISLNNKLRNLQ